MRKLTWLTAFVVVLAAAPARVSAQNPTGCWGGWTEQTLHADEWKDMLIILILIGAAFPQLLGAV